MQKKKKSTKPASPKAKAKVKAAVKKAAPKPKTVLTPKAPALPVAAKPAVAKPTIVVTHEMIVQRAQEIWKRKIAIMHSNHDEQNWREAEAELRGTPLKAPHAK